MKSRFKLSKRHSRQSFTRSARGVHRKNFLQSTQVGPMRGGIRL